MFLAKQSIRRSKFDSPYYPLVRPKKLTIEQIVDERRRLRVPSCIDKWITDGMAHTTPPIRNGPGDGYRSLEYLLWEDEVEVNVNVTRKEGLIEDPFQDLPIYSLNLHISVPPTSGFLIFFWKSPSVVISTFTGEPEDKTAPEWLELVAPTLKFWQRRSLMADLMLHFSELPQNERVSMRVKQWCHAISLPSSGLSTSVYCRPHFNPIEPRNTRRHKMRACNWFSEETQRVLKELDQDSPVRRCK